MNEQTERWYRARVANADGEVEKAAASRDYLMAVLGSLLAGLDQPELPPTTTGVMSYGIAEELAGDARFLSAEGRGEGAAFVERAVAEVQARGEA